MGLSPEDWRRALALSGASQDTLGLFDGLDDETLRRMRIEQARLDREETERALLAANGAPDYDERAARGDFGGLMPRDLPANPYEDAAPDMTITPEEVDAFEREQRPPAAMDTVPLPQPRGARAERRAALGDSYDAMADPNVRDDTRALIEQQGGVPDLGVAFQAGAPPAAVNAALARTGSDYRLPTREPAMPDSMAIMEAEGRLNEQKHADQARSYERQAAIEGMKGTRGLDSVEQSRANVEQRRARAQAFEQQAMARLNELTALVDSPPEETVNAGRAIMGAILNVASGGRVSDGREQMARQMAANVERWKAQIAGNKEAMESLLAMSKHQGSAAEFDAKLDHSLLEYEFGAMNQFLEREKLGAKSLEERNAAQQAQMTLLKGYHRNTLYSTPLEQLAAAAQAGELDEEGMKIFQERAEGDQKLEKGALDLRKGEQDLRQGEQDLAKGPLEMERLQAEIEAKRAEAAKKQREAAGEAPGARVAGGYEIADPQVWANTTAATRGNFEKGIIAIPSLITQLNELRDLVREHGTETFPTVAKGKMQAKSSKILGSIKEAEQLGALDRGVTELVERQIGDVTAWNAGFGNWIENADVRLDETAKIVAEGAQSRAAALGLRPMTLKPDQVAAPAPSDSVTIRTPDGRVGTIPRANLEAALKIPGTRVVD